MVAVWLERLFFGLEPIAQLEFNSDDQNEATGRTLRKGYQSGG
jgi:hypothetical protein